MKPEQQRIAIAEICGWTSIAADYPVNINDGDYYTPWPSGRSPSYKYSQLPDYLNDLNAMHEAEKCLLPPERGRWAQCLEKVVRCNINEVDGIDYDELAELAHATAAQRAEAFLRTLGKWVD